MIPKDPMKDWLPDFVKAQQHDPEAAARWAAKGAENQGINYFGLDREIDAGLAGLSRVRPRSLWTRWCDAWRAARSAWKWGPS